MDERTKENMHRGLADRADSLQGGEQWDNPAVSTCRVTSDHASCIKSALDGFLMQEVNFIYEILIYGDAPTDGTADIIREYVEQYPYIIGPILRKENQHSKGIPNISIFNFPGARRTYIAIHKSDDYQTDSHKLQKQVDYLKEHPCCSLYFHSAEIISVDDPEIEGLMHPRGGSRRAELEEIVDKTSSYPTISLVFPARIVKRLPDYYLDYPVGGIPTQLMVASAGDVFHMGEPMCVYRVDVASFWTNLMKQGDYEGKQKRYGDQVRETHQAFDRATRDRFYEQVVSIAARIYFLAQVNTKHYDQIMSKEYRRCYRELSFRARFFIWLGILAPGLCRLPQRMVRGSN